MQAISLKTIFARWVDAMDRRDLGNAYVVSGLAPTAFGLGSLRVDVAAGTYVVAAGTFAAFAGGNKTPGAAHASLPRVDLIYIDNAGVLQIAAGVAASPNPIPPALPAGALAIAMPFVAPGATDYSGVTASYIADMRQYNAMPFIESGTVGAPGLPFGAEKTTGLWRPGASKVGISIAGAAALEIGAGYIAIGTTPATVGAARLENNQAVYGRNNGNTGNRALLYYSAADIVTINESGGTTTRIFGSGLVLGDTNPAASGQVRLQNNAGGIRIRNSANSGDVQALDVDASDIIQLAASGQAIVISGNVGMASATKITTAASASGQAGLGLPHGAAPSSPVNGDLWTTTSGVFARINGATQGPFSSSGAAHIEAKSAASDGTGLGTQTWTSAFGVTPAVVASPVSTQTDAGLNVASRSTSGATTRGDGAAEVHMVIAMEPN